MLRHNSLHRMMMNLSFFFSCLCLLFASTFQKSVVDIACLYPSDSTGLESEAAIDAIELAVQHINDDPDVLPDYTLKVTYRNSGCDNLIGLASFFEFLQEHVSGVNYQAILGALCSVVTGPVAEFGELYNISTVSYGSTSPTLTNTERYPLLLLGTPSDINTVSGQLLFIRQHNFRRVAIISQQEEIFGGISERLQTYLTELDIEYTNEIFNPRGGNFLPSLELILGRFQEGGYRVIVSNMYQEEYVNTLCLLRKFPNLQPTRTTWIVLGWYSSNWSENVLNVTNGMCTLEDIIAMSNGSPAVNPSVRFEDFSLVNEPTISGQTPAEIYAAYMKSVVDRESQAFFDENIILYDAYAYDCTWTIALALHNLSYSQNLTTTRVNTKEMFRELQRIEFRGWTGNVLYFNRERYDGRVQLSEIVDGQYAFRGLYEGLPLNQSTLATYNNYTYVPTNHFVHFNPETASDGIEIHYFHISIFSLTLIFSLLGFSYVTFLILVIIFGWVKKYEAVTRSEPFVTIIIISGVYCIFLLAFLWSIDERFLACSSKLGFCSFICHFRIWLLAVSISVIFGGMLGKALKYYIIAIKHQFSLSKYLQSYHMLLLPLVLIVIDTIYFLIWGLVSPFNYVSSNVNSGQSDPPIFTVSECRPENARDSIIFVGILITFKSILVLIGLFLAYHLRKVMNKANKYSSIITWTMYNVLIFNILLILVLYLAPTVDLKYGLLCLIALIEGVVVSSIIAGPVLYYMYKDPHGKTFKPPVCRGEFPEDSDQLKKKIRTLEGENRELKDKISTSVIIDNNGYEPTIKVD